ncbi:MAG: PQQ-binding-like beta-propeller repeat protein, partial [Spirochaetia bacterium]|nr:PQQ-binding-like beta-propeller repeat protein [Spirochaetia bacterium]
MSEGLDLSTERLKKKLDRIIARGSDDFKARPQHASKKRLWVLVLSGLLSLVILAAAVLLFGKARKIPASFQWTETSSLPIFSKLVATPFLSDAFHRSGKSFGVGDMSGTFHLFDAATSKKSVQFTADSSLIASPFQASVNGKTGIVLLSRKGTLTFLSEVGNPHWSVQPHLLAGEPGSEFLAKPLLIEKSGGSVLILADGLGRVYAVGTEKGELLWVNRDSPLNSAAIFAAAIGNQRGTVFLANVSGVVAALDSRDGRCLWSQKLSGGVKAGMALAPFLGSSSTSMAVACLDGSVHLLDPQTGAVQKSLSIKDAVIATPLAFQTRFFSTALLVVSTISGNVHLLDFSKNQITSTFPAGPLHP